MNSPYQAVGDRILIRPIKKSETMTSTGGIIIPDAVSEEKLAFGMVINMGAKCSEGEISPGDLVYYSEYSIKPLEDEEDYFIIAEDDILARGVDG